MSESRTAVVIVRPPGYEDHQPITSENLHRALPTDRQVELVRQLFADAGFELSQAFAGSFSITGDVELFADKLPPLPTSSCEGWLAPARGLLHAVTPADPVTFDADSDTTGQHRIETADQSGSVDGSEATMADDQDERNQNELESEVEE